MFLDAQPAELTPLDFMTTAMTVGAIRQKMRI